MYNCHIHTFTEKDVPRNFLPLGLVRVLSTKAGFRTIANILNNINPFSNKDFFDRYVRFVEIARFGSQIDIFKECSRFYPADSRFIVLSMDMANMNAGKVPRKYEEQLDELIKLKNAFPTQVIPFIHIDPRRGREEVKNLLKTYRGINKEGIIIHTIPF